MINPQKERGGREKRGGEGKKKKGREGRRKEGGEERSREGGREGRIKKRKGRKEHERERY